jgi:hypothetical protein
MPKKLSRIEREMRDHPEKFDFGDFPPLRKITPAQQASYDALAPDWVKRFKKNTAYLRQLEAEQKIVIDAFKANFKAANSWRSF